MFRLMWWPNKWRKPLEWNRRDMTVWGEAQQQWQWPWFFSLKTLDHRLNGHQNESRDLIRCFFCWRPVFNLMANSCPKTKNIYMDEWVSEAPELLLLTGIIQLERGFVHFGVTSDAHSTTRYYSLFSSVRSCYHADSSPSTFAYSHTWHVKDSLDSSLQRAK